LLVSLWASKPTRSEEELLGEYGAPKELSLKNEFHLRALLGMLKYLYLVVVNYSEDLLEEYGTPKELSLMTEYHLRALLGVVQCLHLVVVNYSEDLLEE
jgi:hypothetical protein